MSKLTIKEIAKIAGVSLSAVSIVLNNRKGVSEETRKRVLEIVEKLQYFLTLIQEGLFLTKQIILQSF